MKSNFIIISFFAILGYCCGLFIMNRNKYQTIEKLGLERDSLLRETIKNKCYCTKLNFCDTIPDSEAKKIIKNRKLD